MRKLILPETKEPGIKSKLQLSVLDLANSLKQSNFRFDAVLHRIAVVSFIHSFRCQVSSTDPLLLDYSAVSLFTIQPLQLVSIKTQNCLTLSARNLDLYQNLLLRLKFRCLFAPRLNGNCL